MYPLEFDPRKDRTNVQRHGLSLEAAGSFEWDTCIEWLDGREDYGEERWAAIGYIGDRLMYLVFTDRPPAHPTVRRIISLRKATKQEIHRYAQA